MTRPALIALALLLTAAGLWALATAHPLAPSDATDYDMGDIS